MEKSSKNIFDGRMGTLTDSYICIFLEHKDGFLNEGLWTLERAQCINLNKFTTFKEMKIAVKEGKVLKERLISKNDFKLNDAISIVVNNEKRKAGEFLEAISVRKIVALL